MESCSVTVVVKGLLKSKCPYCHHLDAVDSVATDKQSCLVSEADGSFHIDHTHAYYYQVQTQLFACSVDYCDFCVCTFPTGTTPSLHMEHILPDVDCWSSCAESSTHFFKYCLHPELLGNWYTKSSIPTKCCLLYTSPSPRDATLSRMPSSA